MPLTDEQIDEIGKGILGWKVDKWEGLQPWVFTFARAIERAATGAAFERAAELEAEVEKLKADILTAKDWANASCLAAKSITSKRDAKGGA